MVSVISYTRRMDTPARYISIRVSSHCSPGSDSSQWQPFKGNPLELGHLEGDFTGSGNEATATVAAAVALALFIAS